MSLRTAGRLGTRSPMGPFAHWISPVYALAAGTLVPWALFLALTLPAEHDGAHWRVAWLGLDVGLFIMLTATAVAAARRSPWLEGVAMAAAALLLCDAWFDVTTAHTSAELTRAVVLSLVTELPLALLSVAVAKRAEHALARLPLDQLSDSPVRRPAAHMRATRPFAVCSRATSGTSDTGE